MGKLKTKNKKKLRKKIITKVQRNQIIERRKRKEKLCSHLFLINSFSLFINNSFISPWRDHHPHEYTPFRFTDNHHHYDPTVPYYSDAATAAAIDSYTSSAAAAAYSPYMVHHHSPPSTAATTSSPSIKSETAAAAAALQSALSLPTPMNVNVSMNFNSHSVQYTAGYGSGSNAANFNNSPYETFYHPTGPSHYPFATHSPEIKSNRSTSYLQADPVTTKQAMFLSAAAANYDYKDLSKLYDFFPTPSSSSSTSMNTYDKRKYILSCF